MTSVSKEQRATPYAYIMLPVWPYEGLDHNGQVARR
jgi:hypothetical protein